MQNKLVDVSIRVSIRARAPEQTHVALDYTTKCIAIHPLTVSYVSDWLYMGVHVSVCKTYWDPKWSKSMAAACRRHFVRPRQSYTFFVNTFSYWNKFDSPSSCNYNYNVTFDLRIYKFLYISFSFTQALNNAHNESEQESKLANYDVTLNVRQLRKRIHCRPLGTRRV